MNSYLRCAALAVVVVAGTGAGAQRAMEVTTSAEYPLRLSSGTPVMGESFFQSDYFTQPRLTIPTATLSAIISPTLSVAYALDRTVRLAKTPFMAPPTQPNVLAQRLAVVWCTVEQQALAKQPARRVVRTQSVRAALRAQKQRRLNARMAARQLALRCRGNACASPPAQVYPPRSQ